MDEMKAKRAKIDICEILTNADKGDFEKPAITEHLKNLVKLYHFYDEESKKEETGYAMGMGRNMAMDDGRGGMGMENRSYGRWAATDPGSAGSYAGYSYGASAKEQMRQMMADPALNFEAKEYLRKAMENLR